MFLNGHILMNSVKIWTTICKSAIIKWFKPVSGAIAQGFDVCSLHYKDDIQ